MEIENYKSNSIGARDKTHEKEEAPKKKDIQKVTTGTTRTKKKSKFKDSFMAKDVKDVGEYLFGDVLIPTLKRTISDMISNGVEMALFGEVRSKRGRRDRDSRRTPYRDYYDRDRHDDRYRRRPAYDYESVIVETRGEAELVLDKMDEIIDKFDAVTINDLYDLVGYDGGRFTDSKYGWTSLRNVDINQLRDGGYEIVLPEPKQV